MASSVAVSHACKAMSTSILREDEDDGAAGGSGGNAAAVALPLATRGAAANLLDTASPAVASCPPRDADGDGERSNEG
jgi:hypothetical protein